jgi:hypothetical protein
MNEARAFPNLEAGADAWHVYATGVLDGGPIIVMLGVDRVIDVVAVIDEVNPIKCHDPSQRAHPNRRAPCLGGAVSRFPGQRA